MQSIQTHLQKNQKRFIQELCEYVRFPSISTQPKHQKDIHACAKWIQTHCQKIGLISSIRPTNGNPVVIAKTPKSKSKHCPRFLIYGHYDVQPPEPFELWHSPPFEPRIKGRSLFARGASDNKGEHFAHLKAIEAYLKTETPLPCDLIFLIEGEEEIGSPNLASFLKKHRSELQCNAVIISDNTIPSLKHPALGYALRGIAALEIKIWGPSRDLHSGIYGGSVDNPALVLCQIFAKLRDKNGRITVPGFYDDVQPLTTWERKELARIPYSKGAYQKFLGVRELFGECGFTSLEQRTARPTFEINGLTSGYQGEGTKTIIPAWASAKITCRLVPNQSPKKITQLIQQYLERICPPTVRMEIKHGHHSEPYFVSPRSALAEAALRALRSAFGYKPILMREGGSIPVTTDFKKILKADTLLLGLALPDDNLHSPNEKFSLDCFAKGMQMSAYLWQELVKAKNHE